MPLFAALQKPLFLYLGRGLGLGAGADSESMIADAPVDSSANAADWNSQLQRNEFMRENA